MTKFIRSGGAFLLLAAMFMVIAAISEKPSVYTSLGALWLVMAIVMNAKNKQKASAGKQDNAA